MDKLSLELKQERDDLVNAMCSRLQAASAHHDICFDDVTLYTAYQLKELHILKEVYGLPAQPRRGLSTQNFNHFHSFVLHHGNVHQQARLLMLNWYQDNDDYCTLYHDHHHLIIPKRLQPHI